MSATAAPADRSGSAADRPILPVRHRGLLTLAVMAGMVMVILDTTIANVALPHMQASLGATQDSITWVLTSYIIASAVAIPVTGWLADRIGSRQLFLWSVALFIFASMLCGIATNLPEMVAFRLVQGVAGAFIAPLAQTVMLDINAPSSHGRAMAIYGMGIMVGPIMGPVLGGWLTENFSWRWVFYVNLPVGLLSLAGLWALLPAKPVQRRSFDLGGFAFLALALGALQLMLDRGAHVDWFNSPEIWIEAGVAAGSLWMFLVHLLTGKNPLFQPDMLADRNFTTGLLFMLVLGLVLMAGMALMPPMMQGLFGYPVIDTGLLLAARGVGVVVTMGIAARLSERLDPRLLVFAGFTTVAYSLWQMTGWSLEMDWRPIMLSGFVQGLGVGLVFVPLNVITFATLPPHYRTDAASLVNLIRNIGGSVGIAIVAALLARNIQVSHADLAGHVTEFSLPVDPNVALRMGSAGDAAMAMLNGEINRQAAMIAYLNDFHFMMWLTIAALPLVLLLRKPEGRKRGDDPHLIFE